MLSIGKSAYGRTKKLNFYVWRSYQYIEVDKNWEIVWEHLLFLFNAGMDGGAVCYDTCFFGVIKYQLAILNITLTPVLKGSEALFVLSFILVDCGGIPLTILASIFCVDCPEIACFCNDFSVSELLRDAMTISRRVSNLISCSVLSIVFDHISPGQKGLDSGGHLSLVLPNHGLSLYLLYKILALEDSFHVNELQRPAYLVSFVKASLPCWSLFASENIRTGDCILKVPYSVEITPDNLLPKIRAILSDKIGTVSKLAIILLVERKMGQSSGWAPYICCLPQHGEIHSPIFWSEYELNMICQSSVYQETVNQKAKIEKDFAAVVP
ncbi:hypothetical protein Goarm_001982, partial [Gossypium armourianum]|nr:hypothetical protein [Gossypium armourianum]